MRSRHAFVIAIAVAGVLLTWQARTDSQGSAFDLVVLGGRIVDGTGNPWFVADVGIKGDSIEAVAPRLDVAGARVIDAQGLTVSPGFIDVHSHSEAREDGQDIIGNAGAENNVRQGVTTVLASPDGGGSVQVRVGSHRERTADAERRADDWREGRKGPPTKLIKQANKPKGPRTTKIPRGATVMGAVS